MSLLILNTLIENGYNIIPVNPTTKEVLGRKSYASISEVPEQVDVVDVFRRSEGIKKIICNLIMNI
jgi:predicted CoA-binding protein